MNRLRLQKGIVLIEVLVASAIFVVGLVAVSQYQGEIQRESGKSKAFDEATLVAQEKLDDLRRVTGDVAYSALDDGSDTLDGVNASFIRSWDISDKPGTDSKDKYVTVTVSWNDASVQNFDPENPVYNSSVTLSGFLHWLDVTLQARSLTDDSTAESPVPGGDPSPDGEYSEDEYAELDGDKIEDVDENISIYQADDDTIELIVKTLKSDDSGDYFYDVVFETSTGAIAMIRGIVTDLYNSSTPYFFTQGGEVFTEPGDVLTSDGGYCVYPESEGYDVLDQNEISTSETASLEDNQARYHCYMGVEWYGNIGLVGFDETAVVCPEAVVAYEEPINTLEGMVAVGQVTLYSDGIPDGRMVVLDDQNFTIKPEGSSCNSSGDDTYMYTVGVTVSSSAKMYQNSPYPVVTEIAGNATSVSCILTDTSANNKSGLYTCTFEAELGAGVQFEAEYSGSSATASSTTENSIYNADTETYILNNLSIGL